MIPTIDDMRKTLETLYHLTGLGKSESFSDLGLHSSPISSDILEDVASAHPESDALYVFRK